MCWIIYLKMAASRKVLGALRLICFTMTLPVASSPSEAASSCTITTIYPGSYLESNLSAAAKLNDCAEYHLLPGVHVISSKLVLNASVVLTGQRNITETPPVVTCSGNISDPTAEFVKRTEDGGFLTFWGSRFVDISEIAFTDCSLSLQFVEVKRVDLHNCRFRNFTQTPVSMFNTEEASVSFCFFESNRAGAALIDKPYRLTAGAVAINVDTELSLLGPNYTFSDCHFINNSATSNSRLVDGASRLLHNAPLNGRGGGIGVVTVISSQLHFTVHRCFFRSNTALLFGGAIYVWAPHNVTSEDVTLTHSHFTQNSAQFGGALHISLAHALIMKKIFSNESGNSTVGIDAMKIQNCSFVDNKAEFGGGGIGILPGSRNRNISDLFEISSCLFFRNSASVIGAAIAITSVRALDLQSLKTPIVFADNVFEGNKCPAGGIVSTYHNSVRFREVTTFASNTGSALRVTSAVCEVEGRVLFRGNDAREVGEGALYLQSNAQLRLFSGSNLEFIQNIGSLGASIVAKQLRQQPFLNRVIGNSQCFLLFADRSTQTQQQNISLSFAHNSALVGAAVYFNNRKLCSTVPFDNLLSSGDIKPSTPLLNRNNASEGQSKNASLSDISTPPIAINILQSKVSTYPGKPFTVNVIAVDEYGQQTAGTFSVRDDAPPPQTPGVLLPSIRSTSPDNTSFTMQYFAKEMDFRRMGHRLSFGVEIMANRHRDIARVSVPLEVTACPPGFTSTTSVLNGLFECRCNNGHWCTRILSCDTSQKTVILQDLMWAVHINTSTDLVSGGLAVYPCPAGYCRCFLLNEESGPCVQVFSSNSDLDSQCSCHRSGYLCGSCSNGTGVTALLDRCEWCSPVHGLLVAALVIIDTVVIFGVMVVSLWKPLHLPSWMYPMIFYVQIASFATGNFPRPFPLYNSLLFYLGSLLGLYFPYDFCLYPNATAVEVYAIKYIPLILASIICPSVIVAAKCRVIKVNYSGVWLILMLLFNQVVYTSASVLNCPRLTDESGTINSVWFVDGTVKCFTGGHIPLALWAIFCLLLCVVAIFAPLIGLLHCKPVDLPLRLRVLKEAVAHPFREDLPLWYLVELMRRTLLIVVIVAARSKSLTLDGPVILTVLFFGLYLYLMPYKERVANLIEVFNLCVFFMVLTGIKVPPEDSIAWLYFGIRTDECGHARPSTNLISMGLALILYSPLVFASTALSVKLCLILRTKSSRAKTKRGKRRLTHNTHSKVYSWLGRRCTFSVPETVMGITDSTTVELLPRPSEQMTCTVIDEESSTAVDLYMQSSADVPSSYI